VISIAAYQFAIEAFHFAIEACQFVIPALSRDPLHSAVFAKSTGAFWIPGLRPG
jgi:hypothetical protein